MTAPYLVRLGQHLGQAWARFPTERRDRHAGFLLKFQRPDGGFTGREGDSDLYYTSFAVRALAMLNALTPEHARRIASYLGAWDWQQLGVIDLMNWLSSALAVQTACGIDLLANGPPDWPQQIACNLEAVRTRDGGYAKTTEGASGSTYHSFLVLLTYQLLGMTPPRPKALVQFLYDRQRDDGGFVEIAPMRRSGTNPTAAAAAILGELQSLDAETRSDIRAFLKDVRGGEGGFQANTRVPFCDGLSTFTGLLTCREIGCEEIIDRRALRQWVESQLEFPTGGFRAAAWDNDADVEYTFYGLGLLGLLEEGTSIEHRGNIDQGVPRGPGT